MDDLLNTLLQNKKLTVEQLVELLSDYSRNPLKFNEQLEPIDMGIHIAHAVKSGMCFPYFSAMLLHGKAVAFKLDNEEIDYPGYDFAMDIEECSSLSYLTDSLCFYFEKNPKFCRQGSEIEGRSYRERIMEFSPVKSYDLGCIVNIMPYGLQTENISLPNPLDCKGNEIMMLWLKEFVKKGSPFELEARHYKKFKSFFKVPGLQIYYPIHNFGDTKERGVRELEQFQEYFAEKVEPRLEKILSSKLNKGLSIEECVDKAREYITDQGICLLLFDVKGSRKVKDQNNLQNRLEIMMQDLNSKFSDYFPENSLAAPTRIEKGFQVLLGDGSWAGINHTDIIPEIYDYQKTNYPDIPVYWGVAKDGFDKEGVSVVK